MRVRNLNGVSAGAGDGVSWLARWEKFSGQNAFMCFAEGCINRPSAGGRVLRDSLTDRNWYVIPLCKECNEKSGKDLEIWDPANLVSVHAIEALEMPTPAQDSSPRVLKRFAFNG
jgi:hypothetical protein